MEKVVVAVVVVAKGNPIAMFSTRVDSISISSSTATRRDDHILIYFDDLEDGFVDLIWFNAVLPGFRYLNQVQ